MLLQSLPVTVLLNIFEYIKDTQQLVECRRLCKSWDPVAEMAILCRPITITSKEALLNFLFYMQKNQNVGRLVKDLTICRDNYDDDDDDTVEMLDSNCRKLLPWIFTAGLRVLNGVKDDGSYMIMSQIVEKTTAKKYRLKRIGNPVDQKSSEYRKTTLYFTESLQHVYVYLPTFGPQPGDGIHEFIEKLGEFRCLTSLDLTIRGIDLFALKRIVDNCRQLETLSIDWVEPDSDMTSQEVRTWFSQHDTQNNSSLKVLKVDNCFSCIPIEYLVLKYLKIETAFVDTTFPGYNDEESEVAEVAEVNEVTEEVTEVNEDAEEFTTEENLFEFAEENEVAEVNEDAEEFTAEEVAEENEGNDFHAEQDDGEDAEEDAEDAEVRRTVDALSKVPNYQLRFFASHDDTWLPIVSRAERNRTNSVEIEVFGVEILIKVTHKKN